MVSTMDRQIPLTPHSKALLEHRDELLAEAKRCGLTNVRVFGSIARGDATDDSDIDLLAAIIPGTKDGLRRYDLSMLAADLTGRKVDLLFDSQLAPEERERPSQVRFREAVLEDAVPI